MPRGFPRGRSSHLTTSRVTAPNRPCPGCGWPAPRLLIGMRATWRICWRYRTSTQSPSARRSAIRARLRAREPRFPAQVEPAGRLPLPRSRPQARVGLPGAVDEPRVPGWPRWSFSCSTTPPAASQVLEVLEERGDDGFVDLVLFQLRWRAASGLADEPEQPPQRVAVGRDRARGLTFRPATNASP